MKTLHYPLLNYPNIASIFCFSLLVTTLNCFATSISDTVAASRFSELYLSVIINHKDTGEVSLFLQLVHGELLASKKDLRHWHIALPVSTSRTLVYDRQDYYCLNQFPGLIYQINMATMSIELQIPIRLFRISRYNMGNNVLVKPMPSPPGGFLNYDINEQQFAHQSQLGGLFEVSLFNREGLVTNNFLLQHNTDDIDVNNENDLDNLKSNNDSLPENQAVRLNSTWIKDEPMIMQTVHLGDSYNTPGLWGRSVDFGGLQWRTDFETQPGFVTFPLPTLKGEAVVPNIANLYVNNSLIASQDVAPGFFSYNYIPVVTGEGTVTLVTTDTLGRQETVSIPYYASNTLLQAGLKDFSYEAGFIRENYGLNSNDYGKFMLSGTHRLGLSPCLTGELHEELLAKQQTLGMGGSSLISNIGVMTLAVAGSHSDSGVGGLALLGFEHQSLRGFNLGFNTQVSTNQFAQIGYTENNQSPPTLQNQAFFGFLLPDHSSFAISYVQEETSNLQDDTNVNFLNESYTKTYRDLTLNLSAITSFDGYKQDGVFLTLTYYLGHQTTLNVGGSQQNSTSQGLVQLAKALPVGNGYGYDLSTGAGQNQTYQAEVSAQYYTGKYSAAISRQNSQNNYSLETNGSVVELDNGLYLSHQVNESFGVVDIPYGNIPVYENNQYIGVTNKNGKLLLPDLLPYQNNLIRIDQNRLPLDAEVNAAEMNVIPYYRSGVVAQLPIRPAHAAIMQLVQASGEPVPVGAEVRICGQNITYPVGDQGSVYITNLDPENVLVANWDGQHCSFHIHYSAEEASQLLPSLGVIQCL